MMRQRDTAVIVMREIGLGESNLQIDYRLDEYDHVGVMAGHTADISFATATTPERARTDAVGTRRSNCEMDGCRQRIPGEATMALSIASSPRSTS